MAEKSNQKLKDKKIGDIVSPRLIKSPAQLSLREAVDLMRQEQSSYLVLTEGKRVVGMFTESDLIKRILKKNVDWAAPLSQFMSKDPLVLRLDDTVGKAVDLMAENDIYHVPLVNEKQELVNVLSVRTLIRFLAEFYPGEVYNLPPNPHQIMGTAEGG